MPLTHLQFNDQITHGRKLRSAITKLEEGRRELGDIISTLSLMINGDGSSITHFDYMTTKLGTADNTASKGIWDELNSAYSKINTDASVSSVLAALNQLSNKLR